MRIAFHGETSLCLPKKTTSNALKENPRKYAPLSPRKILALGKLKNSTEKQTINENKIKYFM